jgi:hypothetical protein
MTADVIRIHEHRCQYILRVGNRSICVSSCHYGQPISRVVRDAMGGAA